MIIQRTRVSVLADDPVTLAGLGGQLRTSRALDVVPFRSEQLPAVVVIGAAGFDAEQLRRVRAVQYGGRTQVVAVVGELDGASLLEGIEAGACVIIRRRDATNERLLEGVRMAATGEGSVPGDLLSRLMRRVGESDPLDASATPATARHSLTHREIKVLRLLADGCSTAEIAAELAYSESTIKGAIHELTSRLDLRNRSHAVAYALRAGLI